MPAIRNSRLTGSDLLQVEEFETDLFLSLAKPRISKLSQQKGRSKAVAFVTWIKSNVEPTVYESILGLLADNVEKELREFEASTRILELLEPNSILFKGFTNWVPSYCLKEFKIYMLKRKRIEEWLERIPEPGDLDGMSSDVSPLSSEFG